MSSAAKPEGVEPEAADLVLAGGMAFLAGATDIYGLARLGDLFVSFMSGNTTQLGKAIGGGDVARAGEAAAIIAVFVLGAAAGGAVAEWAGRRRTPAVLGMVAALLLAALGWPAAATALLIAAMGALNAALTHVGSASIGLTYVTGSLVKFGQGIGRTLARRRSGGAWSWTLQGVMWLCLLAGAVAATMASSRLGASPWPLPVLAAALTVAAIVRS